MNTDQTSLGPHSSLDDREDCDEEGSSLEETETDEEETVEEDLCSSANEAEAASLRLTLELTLGDLAALPSPPPNLFSFNLDDDLDLLRFR